MADDKTEIIDDPEAADPEESDSWSQAATETIAQLKQAADDATKTQRTLLAVAAAKEEQQVANRATIAAGGSAYEFGRGIGVLQPPAGPQGRGRMYMGPAMSQDQEAAFMQSPQGTRIAPPPPAPLSEDDQAAMQNRMAKATAPRVDPRMSAIGEDQFQAQESYNRAVASGTPKDVAAQIYLPQLFAAKTPRPQAQQQQPKYMHVGNQLVKIDENGAVPVANIGQASRPSSTKVAPPDFFTQQDYRSAQVEKNRLSREISMDPQSPDNKRKQERIDELTRQQAAMKNRGQTDTVTTPPPEAPTAAPSEPTAKNEIARKTADGRIAIYDAKTKKFLRYGQ